jgi:trans-aconitate 2-methyltransferase
MLGEARQLDIGATWRHANLANWRPEEAADLIYANAALHWLDNHAALFPKIFGWLRPGGVLAVQMPRNFSEPSHTLIAETVEKGPWGDRLRPHLRSSPVAEPAEYANFLLPLADELEIWETRYLHILRGNHPVLAWSQGAALAPLLAELRDEAERNRFLAEYVRRIAQAYPPRPDGTTLFPFRRLFIIARRGRG